MLYWCSACDTPKFAFISTVWINFENRTVSYRYALFVYDLCVSAGAACVSWFLFLSNLLSYFRYALCVSMSKSLFVFCCAVHGLCATVDPIARLWLMFTDTITSCFTLLCHFSQCFSFPCGASLMHTNTIPAEKKKWFFFAKYIV